MHNDYEDIRALTKDMPKWWDENGVPRYCEFHPRHVPNIYADEAVLLRISCQSCGHLFDVGLHEDFAMRQMRVDIGISPSLADQIKHQTIHYGDPPNADCCPGGATMNCNDLAVLQYWARYRTGLGWVRDSALEGPLPDSGTL